jgi:hypothetical protein
MIEASPNPFQASDATSLEISPKPSEGTMVESAPHSLKDTGESDKDATRTSLESSMKSAPPLTPAGTGREKVEGTVVESSVKSSPLPPPQTTGSREPIPAAPVESAVARPVAVPPTAGREPAPKKSALSMPVVTGIAVGLACLIFGGLYLVNTLLSGAATPPTEPPTALVLENTETSVATEAPAILPVATETIAITDTPAATATPNATVTPDTPYVTITDIQVSGNLYVVNYDVHNFPEDANLHVHMFFNTVPPEQAGSPGAGPWKLTFGTYGDPPFTQYGIANRPPGATQMCSLVANPNHSVQLNSGNCVDLPE